MFKERAAVRMLKSRSEGENLITRGSAGMKSRKKLDEV
jgi:hypothetical protein